MNETRSGKKPWAVILAAGTGSRMSEATGGRAKQFLIWKGIPLYWHSALAMSRSAAVGGIVFVFPPEALQREEAAARRLGDLGLPFLAVSGGELRQDSVLRGLNALPSGVSHVLVHDAARPFLLPDLIHRVCGALSEGNAAVIPAVSVVDTVKITDGAFAVQTLPRERLVAAQTPQGFELSLLLDAHRKAREEHRVVTDDASLMEHSGHAVRIVPGSYTNLKITRPGDLRLLGFGEKTHVLPRTGFGYDVHRFGSGRPLKLGGVPIPGGAEVRAHSDGDVLLHALMDALLGCAALGDIGRHFPDNRGEFENISSAVLLSEVLAMLRQSHLVPYHADVTIITQKPKIQPFREEIRSNIARLLSLPETRVNVKATTEEGLGFTGRVEGIKACAVATCIPLAQSCPNPSSPEQTQ